MIIGLSLISLDLNPTEIKIISISIIPDTVESVGFADFKTSLENLFLNNAFNKPAITNGMITKKKRFFMSIFVEKYILFPKRTDNPNGINSIEIMNVNDCIIKEKRISASKKPVHAASIPSGGTIEEIIIPVLKKLNLSGIMYETT